MSHPVLDLREQAPEQPVRHSTFQGFGSFETASDRPRLKKALKIAGLTFLLLIVSLTAGGYLYWQHLKSTPQYSLAMLIDAARRDDKPEIDTLIDTGRVVDSFLPQITSKAIEIYGRGVPNVTIQRIQEISAPLIPAVKDRVRDELLNVIRERTRRFQSIPFEAMVLGAERYMEIEVNGETALVKSKLPDRPFEITLERNGERWRVVAVTDEQLATKISQKVGQDIIAIASRSKANAAGERLGIRNMNNILRQAEDLFR